MAGPRFLDHSAWRPKYLNHDRYGGGIIGRRWVVIAMGGIAELLSRENVELSWFDESGAELRGLLAVSWGAAFERAAPARGFGSFKGQRSFQGSWWFATTGEHVGFESWLERDVLMALDFDADIVAASSQPFWMSWPGEGRPRRHAPDFFARRADGAALVIDVRAHDRIDAHDAEVFAATAEACRSVGWDYERRGELAPFFGANLRWLAGYRHRRCCTPSLADRLVECVSVPLPLGELAAMAGDRFAVLPTLYHLLWRRVIDADLTWAPLSELTVLSREVVR